MQVRVYYEVRVYYGMQVRVYYGMQVRVYYGMQVRVYYGMQVSSPPANLNMLRRLKTLNCLDVKTTSQTFQRM